MVRPLLFRGVEGSELCARRRPVWSTPVLVRIGGAYRAHAARLRAMEPNGTERSKTRISGYTVEVFVHSGTLR
jgi:hypothetical protein